MSDSEIESKLSPFLAKMKAEGLSEAARASFARNFRLLAAGGTGEIPEHDLEPAADLPAYEDLDEPGDEFSELLDRCVRSVPETFPGSVN